MKLLPGIASEKYILSTDEHVSFTLRPLSAAERIDILSTATNAKQYGQAMLLACEYGITGWNGVKDAQGQDAAFDIHNIKLMPVEAMIEVANYILKISKADPEIKKA